MSKVLLWIGVVMLAIYVVKTQYLTSRTYQPFIEGCMASGNASEAQCSCLADYLHQRYSDKEMQAIMNNGLEDELIRSRVEQDIRTGSKACAQASG